MRSVAVLVVAAVLGVVGPAFAQRQVGPAYVTRVASGDLVYAEIGGRLEAIHYIGVNVPVVAHPTRGSEPYAAVVQEMNRRLVDGKWIRLVLEEPSRDRFGRLQAYVWLGDLFVNAALLYWGYGEAAASIRHPRYVTYFRSLEEAARREHRGLWRYGDVLTYYRRRGPEDEVDRGELRERAADSTGGRVFSAPAPSTSVTPAPSSGSAPASVGIPGGPAPTPRTPAIGAPYSTPRR
jgi:endonuclease YncB( thermonuclease family)